MDVLPPSACEILTQQMAREKNGMVYPYINHFIQPATGEKIWQHYYPTLVQPQSHPLDMFACIYMTNFEEDCESNYYHFAHSLLNSLNVLDG